MKLQWLFNGINLCHHIWWWCDCHGRSSSDNFALIILLHYCMKHWQGVAYGGRQRSVYVYSVMYWKFISFLSPQRTTIIVDTLFVYCVPKFVRLVGDISIFKLIIDVNSMFWLHFLSCPLKLKIFCCKSLNFPWKTDHPMLALFSENFQNNNCNRIFKIIMWLLDVVNDH